MRRLLIACTLLTFAACAEPGAGADPCAQRDESYRITTALTLPEPTKSTDDEIPVTSARVLANVDEASSIIACDGKLVSEQTPGRALMSNVPVYIDAAGFTLDVRATVYPELGARELSLSLLFDENGNGRCDDGEPMASTPIERVPHARLSLTLVRGRCQLHL